MTKNITLKNVKDEYQQAIQAIENRFDVDAFMNLSVTLFHSIKAKGIVGADDDGDMLLFQCGKFDWKDELGEHFSFNITRQFITKTDRMFQLSFSLIFKPDDFKNIDGNTFWHTDFSSVAEWLQNLKATEAYKIAQTLPMPKYQLSFSEIG
jgi:hypothetical protein